MGQEFLVEHELDIIRLAKAAAKRRTGVSKEFVNKNMDEFLQEVRILVWRSYNPERAALSTFINLVVPQVLQRMVTEFAERINAGDIADREHPSPDERRPDMHPHAYDGGIDTVIGEAWVQSVLTEKMTDHQAEIVRLLMMGHSTRKAGAILGIEGATVSWHVRKRIAPAVEEAHLAALAE